ncbi:MAG: amidohydrolase family protein [Gemmatimonadota bacterium]
MSVLRAAFAVLLVASAPILLAVPASAQLERTTDRGADEGEGPFERLIIRGANLVDGSGAPMVGPVDIVIEGNRIVDVQTVGSAGVPIDPAGRPQGATREIDAHGHYVLPGLIDVHAHLGDPEKAPQSEYVHKLFLGHGITTVRGVELGLGDFFWGMEEKERSARNEIVAPRLFQCIKNPDQVPGWDDPHLMTPEAGRAWVRFAAEHDADCLKLGRYSQGMMSPPVMQAILDEARELGLGTTAHLHQNGVAEMNAVEMARAGLVGLTHFYGLFESMYDGYDIQPFPNDYNYADEQDRFGYVAEQWHLIHERGSPGWNELIQEFLENDFYLNPTLTTYESARDVMRNRNADWHDTYTLPSMWDFYTPSRTAHGSFWFDWTTAREVAWRNYYRRWMEFVQDYKNAGGKVTAGADAGYLYNLFGFTYIRELELLQEAGFHPLEVVRAATMHAAEELVHASGEPIEFGLVRPGYLADLLIVEENPLHNFKVLYGTGHVRLNDDTDEVERVGGVKYTIKDGIVYDAKQLMADVAEMVREQKVERGMDPDAPLPRY